jgi:hypothetical protein
MRQREAPESTEYLKPPLAALSKNRNTSGNHTIELNVLAMFMTDTVKPENIKVTLDTSEAGPP